MKGQNDLAVLLGGRPGWQLSRWLRNDFQWPVGNHARQCKW